MVGRTGPLTAVRLRPRTFGEECVDKEEVVDDEDDAEERGDEEEEEEEEEELKGRDIEPSREPADALVLWRAVSLAFSLLSFSEDRRAGLMRGWVAAAALGLVLVGAAGVAGADGDFLPVFLLLFSKIGPGDPGGDEGPGDCREL